MAMLSNEDIKKELGRNILIHPFISENLKGASLNLTASKLGWSIATGKSIYDSSNDQLVIPPDSTVCIETEESIYVADHIGGTYHSRVSLVSAGLSHIGTTLDPGWVGSSLIAIHNHRNKPYELKVGDPFVTLVFYYLKTNTTHKCAEEPCRQDIINQFEVSDEEKRWLDQDWRKVPAHLLQQMKSHADYNKFIEERKNKHKWLTSKPMVAGYILIVTAIMFFVFHSNEANWHIASKDYLLILITACTLIFNQFTRKNSES